MRVDLVFGFLGSGKTTLLRRILAEPGAGRSTAVIVNEFGDLGIDGATLEGRGLAIVELTSGCLCCTLKGALADAIEELRDDDRVERIVVEASGIAQPAALVAELADPKIHADFEIGPLITVVDAARFAALRDMLGPFYLDQMGHADVVVLNKIDLADATVLEALGAEVAGLNAAATVLYAEHCDIDLERALDGRSRWHGRGGDIAGRRPGHGHVRAVSAVLDTGGTIARAAAEEMFAGLPQEVWRAKGFMMVDGRASLVQYAMGQLTITRAAPRQSLHVVFVGARLDRADLEARFARARNSGGRKGPDRERSVPL